MGFIKTVSEPLPLSQEIIQFNSSCKLNRQMPHVPSNATKIEVTEEIASQLLLIGMSVSLQGFEMWLTHAALRRQTSDSAIPESNLCGRPPAPGTLLPHGICRGMQPMLLDPWLRLPHRAQTVPCELFQTAYLPKSLSFRVPPEPPFLRQACTPRCGGGSS